MAIQVCKLKDASCLQCLPSRQLSAAFGIPACVYELTSRRENIEPLEEKVTCKVRLTVALEMDRQLALCTTRCGTFKLLPLPRSFLPKTGHHKRAALAGAKPASLAGFYARSLTGITWRAQA